MPEVMPESGGANVPISYPQDSSTPGDTGNPNAPSNPNPPMPSDVVNTDQDTGAESFVIIVNGKPVNVVLNTNLHSGDSVVGPPSLPVKGEIGAQLASGAAARAAKEQANSVRNKIASISKWWGNAGTRQQVIDQLYAAGLITSKKAPSIDEVTNAWSTVVQEAALENQQAGVGGGITPEQLLAKAAQSGWNNIGAIQGVTDAGARGTGNPNNATETSSQSQTIYKSYVDPATAAGTLADAYYRLMGRNPTRDEYNAFFNSLYSYQEKENTGKLEQSEKGPITGAIDPATGQPVDQTGTTSGTSTTTNVVSQRGIGMRGVQFLAGQQALTSPEEGAYQAATTYFNAFIKALQGPASGMEASGPTTTVP